MKDQAVKERFVELRAKGWSFDRIGKEVQVSKQTLITWSRDLALEIRNMRAIEHEALLEQYALTRNGRIEFLGDLLKKLREELAARSLATVSTERLIDLALKVEEEWKNAMPELKLGTEEGIYDGLLEDKSVAYWSA